MPTQTKTEWQQGDFSGVASFDTWRRHVQSLFQNEAEDFHEVAEHYSFRAAFNDGMSPEAAIRDALEWLAA